MSLTPIRVRKRLPLKGRRTSWPEDDIGEDYSPGNLNVRFRFGEVRNSPGRDIFSGPETIEPATFIGQFPLIDGSTIWTVKLTTTDLFRLGNTTPGNPEQWHQVLRVFLPTGTRRWNATVGENHLFFCKGGGNAIMQWDGNPAHFWDIIVPLDGVVPIARYLEYFNNRLVSAFTTEAGQTFANRVRWARNGDFRRWDSSVGLGAGFLDVTDENEEAIQGIRGLGERLVIYTKRSVKEMIATGTLDPVHVVQTRSRGVGCAAPYTIASNGVAHYFMAYDRNVWSWDGSQLIPVGEPIWEELKALTYPNFFDSYFGYCSPCRNEYWLVLYPGSDVFVYDYLRGTWSRDSIANFTALGEIDRVALSRIWLDLIGSWLVQTAQWQQFSGTSFTSLVGGLATGATMTIDESTVYDYFAVGSIMDRYVETPDYYLNDDPMEDVTLKRALMIYKYAGTSSPYEFGVSVDHGVTWDTHQVFPNTLGYSFVDLNITGNVVRFRFRENDATGMFRWRSCEYEFLPGGQFLEPPPAIDNSGPTPPGPPPVDITVGLGTDDSYTGTITVTPPGTVYGPFIGGGGGAPICIATLTYPEGTVVTFDASPVAVGASWNSSFVDQTSPGSADPLITTINGNTTFGASDPCGVGFDATHGHVYFQSFP